MPRHRFSRIRLVPGTRSVPGTSFSRVKRGSPAADDLTMLRRLLRLPKAHRSVPVKTLRRWKLA